VSSASPTVTAAPHAAARSIWTRLTVDPVVMPLAPRVGRWTFVTPNRITALAGLLAAASVACFALGQLRLGGLLFILRYMADCLDGQVARVQRRGSSVGAAFDITVDVVGISAVFAGLTWHLVTQGRLPLLEALALLALVVVYNWALAYRKALAKAAGSGDDGGAGGMLPTAVPGLRRWSQFCGRIGMSPLPWAVEAEILALGVGPLLLPTHWVPLGLHCAVAFYVLANVVNLRRIFRIAGAIDSGSSR
jgi:phosphatidylglycerophosphate synthase